jgi:hypothetical protein
VRTTVGSSGPTTDSTDDIAEIKSAVSGLKTDTSGIERTFHAVHQAATRFRQFRTQEPRRNVLFVIFTDEAGDDEAELDSAVAICRRHAIPVYCVGVPAPFGRRDANIKYIDPDPKYDQSVQWIPVRQGPESYLPELVKQSGEGAVRGVLESHFISPAAFRSGQASSTMQPRSSKMSRRASNTRRTLRSRGSPPRSGHQATRTPLNPRCSERAKAMGSDG